METNEHQKPKRPAPAEPIIEREVPCSCGSTRFREAHRITQKAGAVSVMYECADCGAYRL